MSSSAKAKAKAALIRRHQIEYDALVKSYETLERLEAEKSEEDK